MPPPNMPPPRPAPVPPQQTRPDVSPAPPGTPSRSRFLVAGGIAIAALVAVGGFVTPGFFVGKRLDVDNAEKSIAALLSDPTNTFGAVSDVRCNDGHDPRVKRGSGFTCTLTIDGREKQVTATFTDNDGNYQVGVPK